MKTLLLITFVLLSATSIGQARHRYRYELKLENTPSRFTITEDSANSQQSIKIFVSDFSGQIIPFAKVNIFTPNLDTTLYTDVSGYVYLPITESNCRVTISFVSYNNLEIDTLKIINTASTILKVTLTLSMSGQHCFIGSSKKLDKEKIKEIAKKFSANPFNTELLKNKTYAVLCQL